MEDILLEKFHPRGIRLFLVKLNESTTIMYEKLKEGYPYSTILSISDTGMIQVIITTLTAVVDEFKKDPASFKKGLDFHTH